MLCGFVLVFTSLHFFCFSLADQCVVGWFLFLWESHLELPVEEDFSWGSTSGAVWRCTVMSQELVEFLLVVLPFDVGYMPDLIHCFHEVLS